MGRHISFGVVTKIEVRNKYGLKECKGDLLNRIDKVFNLKYYEEGVSDSDDFMCLYLKEDVFNKDFKDLLLELADMELLMDYFYYNIKNTSDYTSSKGKKKALIDYLENHFDLKIKREYEERYDYRSHKKIIDKNNFVYLLDNVSEFNNDFALSWENYFNCTDMCDKTQFNDNLADLYNFRIRLNHIPLYYDYDKTDSEDITFTLRCLNYFLRKALKCEAKKTLIFGLTDQRENNEKI